MKIKKLGALTLSVAMIFTSFSVPTFADEIIDEPIVEIVSEADAEISDEVVEEIVEEPAEDETVAEETEVETTTTEDEVVVDEELSGKKEATGEDVVGSTFSVGDAADLVKYLTPDTGKKTNKYVLSSGNSGKAVTLKLTKDITISGNEINVPGDRYLHIDLNGYELKAASDEKLTLAAISSGTKSTYPTLVVENSKGYEDNHACMNIPVEVNGYDTVTSQDPATKCMFEVGSYVDVHSSITNNNGILKVNKDAILSGDVASTGLADTNIQGIVEESATVSGNGITLANAELRTVSANAIMLGDNSSVIGTTAGLVTAAGTVTVAKDSDMSATNSLMITIADDENAAVVMKSGWVNSVDFNSGKGSFTMYDGRVENMEAVSAEALINVGANSKLNLLGGVIAAQGGHAVAAGTKWQNAAGATVTGTGAPYIIDGAEAFAETGATEGTIKSATDLRKAFKFGGEYVLAAEIKAEDLMAILGSTITLENDLKITGKANCYYIDLGNRTIDLNGHVLTVNANIYGSQSPVVDATGDNDKLIMLGGSLGYANYYSDNGYAVKVKKVVSGNQLDTVELVGGKVYGSASYFWGEGLKHGADKVATATNCAISTGTAGYMDNAVILNGNVPVIDVDMVNQMNYVLIRNGNPVKLGDVFRGCIYGIDESKVKFLAYSEDESVINIDKVGDEEVFKYVKNGSTKLGCYYKYNDVVLASDYVRAEATDKTIEQLKDEYNATLIAAKGSMNAYAKQYKIYFDFHLKGSEDSLAGSAGDEFGPQYASIDAPASSRFSYYLEPLANGMYKVKYDDNKKLFYIELNNSPAYTEGSTAVQSTKLADDSVSKFEGLAINLHFGEWTAGTYNDYFTVPMTKYAYTTANKKGEDITATEQKYTLEISQKKPAVKFTDKAGLKINTSYSKDARYKVFYPNLADADTNYAIVTPGCLTAYDIIDAVNAEKSKNVTISKLEIIKGTNFNSTGSYDLENNDYDLKVFYSGSNSSDSEEESSSSSKKDNKIAMLAEYAGYYGSFPLDVPVEVTDGGTPKVEIGKATFTVEKGKAVSNIPIKFSSKEADQLGAITNVEVVSGRKFFTISQPSDPAIETTDGKKFTTKNYSINVAPLTKKNQSAKIKVTFRNAKLKNGKYRTQTFTVTAKAVDPTKLKVSAKSSDVLNLHTASGNSVATYTVTTNPEYTNTQITVSANAYAKGSNTPISAPWLSVTPVSEGQFKVIANAPNSPTGVNKITAVLTYNINGVVKTKNITVKFSAGKPSVTDKNVTIKMALGTEGYKKYADGAIKVDTTASKMAKSFNYGGKNVEFAYASGDAANLFTVKETSKGKTVKITPNLGALKAGKITANTYYDLDLHFYEKGTTTEISPKSIKVYVDAIKPLKASAAISSGTAVLYDKSPEVGADFTIRTKKPYYGMEIDSVEIAPGDKNAYLFDDIEVVDVTSGFTATKNGEGTNNSTFRILLKDGQVKYDTKGKVVSGVKTVKLLVTYKNGLTANVKLTVSIRGL